MLPFITSPLHGGEGGALFALHPGKDPGLHCTEDIVGHRISLDTYGEEKLSCPTGFRTLNHPACSKLLYGVCFPGFLKQGEYILN